MQSAKQTVRPQDWFASSGIISYADCAGPGAAGLEVASTPGMVFAPDGYDAETDRITGTTYTMTWALGLLTPDCTITLYPPDDTVGTPLTYDNPTATLHTGPVALVVALVEGTGCDDLAHVGDEMTFETTIVPDPGFTVRPA